MASDPKSHTCQTVDAVKPAIQNPDYPHAWWLERHHEKIKEAKRRHTGIKVAFIGDSITQAWETEGKEAWDKHLSHFGAINLGFNGDRTENVLWRLEQGALNDIVPTLFVVLIGTNNTGHRQDPAADTALGIHRILAKLQVLRPAIPILLLALLPRGRYANDPLRLLNIEVNCLIQGFCDEEQVFWCDLSGLFLGEPDAEISSHLMPDFLHLSSDQYLTVAEVLEEKIEELIG